MSSGIARPQPSPPRSRGNQPATPRTARSVPSTLHPACTTRSLPILSNHLRSKDACVRRLRNDAQEKGGKLWKRATVRRPHRLANGLGASPISFPIASFRGRRRSRTPVLSHRQFSRLVCRHRHFTFPIEETPSQQATSRAGLLGCFQARSRTKPSHSSGALSRSMAGGKRGSERGTRGARSGHMPASSQL